MAVRALTLKLAIPKLLKEEEKKRSKQKNEEKKHVRSRNTLVSTDGNLPVTNKGASTASC